MKKYGSTTDYSFVSNYKGFAIVKVVTTYISKYNENKYTHYIACISEEGDKTPWKKGANRIQNSYGHTEESLLSQINSFIAGDKPIITDADWSKYVKRYNYRHGFGFNRNTLLATMRSHKKGDAKMKILMEDRLEDANFHGYCSDLCNSDYDTFMERLNEEFPLH